MRVLGFAWLGLGGPGARLEPSAAMKEKEALSKLNWLYILWEHSI